MGLPAAALIELDRSHDECLYSQLLFLKRGGYETTLFCPEELGSQVCDYDTGAQKVFFKLSGKSELEKLKILWQIRNKIVKLGIKTIIFNSAHGRHVRNLAWMPFPAGTRLYGTLHGINKLKRSATQQLISYRISHYFLLNDYLIQNLKMVPHNGLEFESYYPIFFPHTDSPKPEKPQDELWIAIPGQVEFKRRDYECLVTAVASLTPKPKFRFLLLGNSNNEDGHKLRLSCKKLGIEPYFKFWDGFLNNEVFHSYLQQCDIVMPLIHPGNDGFEKYLKYQITGGFNLAFAYKKPLLMLDNFRRYEDFEENGIFYELQNIGPALQELPGNLHLSAPKMYKNLKWSFEAQKARYLKFIR